MPIYEYKCRKCGKEFEVFQGITAQPMQTCQSCGGPVHKLMSLSTFHLRGNGWYATDYGGKKAPVTEKNSEDKAAPTEAAAAPKAAETASPKEKD